MPFKPSAIAGIAFGVLLLLSIAVAGLAAVGSLVSLSTTSPAEQALREAGVQGRIQAWHEERADGGLTGCVLTDDALVRIEEGVVARRLPTEHAELTLVEAPLGVHVTGPDGGPPVICAFRAGEGIDTFAGLIRVTIDRTSREPWRAVDPRARRFYEDG